MTETKNRLLFMLYALCIGAIIGLIVWLFLRIMNISIEFIWTTIPDKTKIPFYTIIVCTLGGLLIGIWRKKTGDYPESLETVMKKVKTEGKYPYNNIGKLSISAMLPLIFGASVGPEAGLSGVIAGLCSWMSDKFKHLAKEIKDLTTIGMSATLGTIFSSPMFGFAMPLEEENNINIPKTKKITLYFMSIFGAFAVMLLLRYLFGGTEGLINIEGYSVNIKEWLYLIPLTIIGIILGYTYLIMNKFIKKISKQVQKYNIISAIICGLILGIIGTLIPLTMFSGEQQTSFISTNYKEIGIIMLLTISIVKLFLTNTCITLGFKGGHFFPCIFSGISLGYALALITNVNEVFCVCVITTSFIGFILRKPLATVLLLMICFPTNAIFVMLFTAAISAHVKIPKNLN